MSASEIGLRLFGPFPRAGKTPDHVLWRTDAAIGFAPATDLDVIFQSNEWLTRIRTDDLGFRIGGAAPPASLGGPANVVFLGDSQTMGIQVPAEATFVDLVGTVLASRGLQWRVVNAGCNGFNTVQAYLFFRQMYERGWRPRLVVLYATNNDLFEDVAGLPYGRYQLGEDGMLDPAPPDPSALARLAAAKAASAPPANVWLRHSAVLRHAWYSYRIARSSPQLGSWIRNTYLREDDDPLTDARSRVASAAIRSLKRLVASYGGTLIVAVHPDPVEWSDDYYGRLVRAVPDLSARIDRMKIQNAYRRIAERESVAFIDMLDAFPNVDVSDFRFTLDPHANASGHRLIAGQLLKGMDRVGVFRSNGERASIQ